MFPTTVRVRVDSGARLCHRTHCIGHSDRENVEHTRDECVIDDVIEERQTPTTMDFPGEAVVNRVLGGIWGSDLQ